MSGVGRNLTLPADAVELACLISPWYFATMLQKRNLSGIVEVDGRRYSWSLQREPQWCDADGWRGMSIALLSGDGGREAILEFPMPWSSGRSGRQPQRRRPQVNERIIENGIRSAIARGWEPTSKGKSFVVNVDASGG